MIRKLGSTQMHELMRLRETGMGYQFIEATFGYNNQRTKFLVLNAQILIDDTAQILNEVRNVFSRGFSITLAQATTFELKNISLVENLSNYNSRTIQAQKHTGAIYQAKVYANGRDVYTRLSAYADDKRVDTVNKKLLPGSFATTYEDYIYCKNNRLDPVDRYALPNDEPISFAYHVRPLTVDSLQLGIVEPANNHKGGGIEAYFENGTSNNTYFQQTPY